MFRTYEEFLEMLWHTHEGKIIKIKDLSDSHLANIIDFIGDRHYQQWFKLNLLRLAGERGLHKEFLDRAQIPYKNKKGNWEIHIENEFRSISTSKEEVSNV